MLPVHADNNCSHIIGRRPITLGLTVPQPSTRELIAAGFGNNFRGKRFEDLVRQTIPLSKVAALFQTYMGNVMKLPFMSVYCEVNNSSSTPDPAEKQRQMNVICDKILKILWDNGVEMPGIGVCQRAGDSMDLLPLETSKRLKSYMKLRIRAAKCVASATHRRRQLKRQLEEQESVSCRDEFEARSSSSSSAGAPADSSVSLNKAKKQLMNKPPKKTVVRRTSNRAVRGDPVPVSSYTSASNKPVLEEEDEVSPPRKRVKEASCLEESWNLPGKCSVVEMYMKCR